MPPLRSGNSEAEWGRKTNILQDTTTRYGNITLQGLMKVGNCVESLPDCWRNTGKKAFVGTKTLRGHDKQPRRGGGGNWVGRDEQQEIDIEVRGQPMGPQD
ncbi:hypothetical protein K438DRAFT_1754135 [Mycena galopus ATCC 62051]|nr:hypothetical protein K438DRAFT_1754135 [Mycena galopus ATCC 62051]